jgi:hypothetical protein
MFAIFTLQRYETTFNNAREFGEIIAMQLYFLCERKQMGENLVFTALFE